MINLSAKLKGLASFNFAYINWHKRLLGTKPTALSYVHSASEQPLLGKTIGTLFDEAVNRTPDRTAVVFSSRGIRLTFKQLHQKVESVSAGLLGLGVQRGDRVGVWAQNVPEWLFMQFAIARVGAILVNINPAYRSAELRHALTKTGCSVLVVGESENGRQDFWNTLHELVPELQSSPHPEPSAALSQHPRFANFSELRSVVALGTSSKAGTINFVDLMGITTPQLLSETRKRHTEVQFDDIANIQFTSGTTGLPKGVTVTQHAMVNAAYFAGLGLGFDQMPQIICSPLPFYHIFGMVKANLQMLAHNATLIVPNQTFSPAATLRSLNTERCTALYGTPTMFNDILTVLERVRASGEYIDLSALQCAVNGGATIPPALMKRMFTDLKIPKAINDYGATELSAMGTLSLATDNEDERLNTVGFPLPHSEMRVVDIKTGNTIPIGSEGELWVRGYGVTNGYWKEPKLTKEVITVAGWYRTGDIVRMRKSGHIEVVSRLKDMINRGGQKVFPAEVEALLTTHPAVAEAYVVGVPDERLGEQVCACIRLKESTKPTNAEEILEFCKARISKYKCPNFAIFMQNFPLTVTGKVQKFKLKEMAVKCLNRK